jgi:hypothetical protein
MTTAAIRTKLHQYIDEADVENLEMFYQLFEISLQNNSSLTKEQKLEVLERSKLYKSGNTKGYSISEARDLILHRLTKPAL